MLYFVWLLSGLVVATAGLWLRRHQARVGLGVAVIGTVIGIGAIVWQVRSTLFASAPPTLDRYSATVAYYLGQAVLDELRSFEGNVYLLLPPDRGHNARALDSLFNTFARVLAPVSGLQVKDLVVPARESDLRDGRLPREAFERAAAGATGAIACVSCVGWPAGLDRLPPTPGTRSPSWFVFDPTGGTAWLPALKGGIIRRVIVARPNAVRAGAGALTGPPDELFARFFLAVRPKDADAVARELQRP